MTHKVILRVCNTLTKVAFCVFIPMSAAAQSNVNFVKLDLSALTPNQQRDIGIQIVMMAHFEARLENCGFSPDFERRAIDAIKPCVRDDAIAQLRSYYKNQKQIAFKLIFEARDKTGPERVDCSLDSEKDWLRRVSKDLDDQVRKLDRMCRACRICRD